MLNPNELAKLAKEWYDTVPSDMKNKVIVGDFGIKPMTFTPKQILDKINAAAQKSKTRSDFLKRTGLCGEFLQTLERIAEKKKMRSKKSKKGGSRS
jgi:hypothetical protein